MMDDAAKAVHEQARRRVERARQDRDRHRHRLDDIYRFAMPWRHRQGQSQPNQDDIDEIFDSTAMVCLSDFASDMLATFTPGYADWVDMKPVRALGRAEMRRIEAPLVEYQGVLFDEIRRSNFAEAAQEAYFDLASGTVAMLIQDLDPTRPIHCQAIPVVDLLIERGPFGGVDGRWREFHLRRADIAVLWPDARMPDDDGGRAGADRQDMEICVTEGLWRDWSDRGTETWRYVVMTSSAVILDDVFRGAGCCPMIAARWMTDSTTAWGCGPLYTAMPDVKTVNKLNELILKSCDKAIDPPFVYDDDGVLNFQQGIVPGTAIPRMPGSTVDVLESRARFDVAYFSQDDLRMSIRRAMFQDKPDQRGKTPPTATQWLEEARQTARRMGAPAGRLITEWQYPIIQRFAWLLGRRGTLPKVELNGQIVALHPVSPLIRAQQQDVALRLDRFLEILGGRFGADAVNLLVDQFQAAGVLRQALGVDAFVMRDEAQVRQLIETAAQAAQQAAAP
jgi:hypothetical protein